MQIYLVGGAIRDRLLGFPPPYENDWVVVNGTPEDLDSRGYKKSVNLFRYILILTQGMNMHSLEKKVRLVLVIMGLILMPTQTLHWKKI